MKAEISHISPSAGGFRFPIRAKMLVAFVGIAIVPMLLLGLLATKRAERLLTERIAQELSIEVETAADTIEVHLAGIGRELFSLARFLEPLLKTRMTEAEWSGIEGEFLRIMRAQHAYYQVRFIAADGMENIRVNNENGRLRLVPRVGLQYKGDRYYFREAMALPPGSLYLSPLDFNVEHGRIEEPRRLVARMATPVRDPSGRVRGVVVLNVFGEELLGALARLKPAAGVCVLLLDQAERFVEMEGTAGAPRFRAGAAGELVYLADIRAQASSGSGKGIFRGAGQNLLAAAPVHAGPGKVWRLVKVYPKALLFADLDRLRRTILLLALPLVLAAAALAVLAARSFSRPIHQLSGLAAELANGDYGRRSAIASRDELGDLARALNDMAASLASSRERLEQWNQSLREQVSDKVEELRASEAAAAAARMEALELERQLIRADRLASLGMLSATVAHEIGNPLAGLKMRLQMLLRKAPDEGAPRNDLERMLALVDRLADFLTHITGYVAPAGGAARPVDLVQALRELEFILREEAERRRITLTLALPGSALPVCAPGRHLHQIFMNLILNALQATDEGGTVAVAAAQDCGALRVTVRDSGPGLAAGVAERVFEPLFTTKEHGTGLGLAIVKQLAGELGGTVTLENHPQGGAVAEVRLPERSGGCGDGS